MGVAYRLGQFWQLLTARPLSAEAWNEVEAILNPQELLLFRRFDPADQQHSYGVLRTLRQAGHDEPALLAAALLHDIGKTRCRPRLRERVLGAIVEKFLPRRARAWGQGEASGWRRALVIRHRHPQWGAELAQEAGSSPLTVRLIRHHQEKKPPPLEALPRDLLSALQWADDQN